MNISDKVSFIHDKDYDKNGAVGGLDLFLNFSVIDDDIKYVKSQFKVTGMFISQFNIGLHTFVFTPTFDPVTKKPIALETAINAFLQGVLLGTFSAPKIIIHDIGKIGPFNGN